VRKEKLKHTFFGFQAISDFFCSAQEKSFKYFSHYGQKVDGSIRCHFCRRFPGLDIITICASFHRIEKWQRHIMLLYILYVMRRMAFLGRFFSIMTTIRPCPGALCGLSKFIAFVISTGVKAPTGGDSWQGAFQ
jgi:hypothetical protein